MQYLIDFPENNMIKCALLLIKHGKENMSLIQEALKLKTEEESEPQAPQPPALPPKTGKPRNIRPIITA
ncbi:hypothetical protein ACFLQY_01595, partial [Verrucomicrobiota bacterium]